MANIKGQNENARRPFTVHNSKCVVCGRTTLQTEPDDQENRGICYRCYQLMWGRQSIESSNKLRRAAAA